MNHQEYKILYLTLKQVKKISEKSLFKFYSKKNIEVLILKKYLNDLALALVLKL
jgi:hypothetical protein